MKLLILLLLFYSTSHTLEPKREFRAMWVASVFNIDWPSSPNLTIDQQKSEMLKILDTAQELKFNAMILQVKPTSDAFYPSKLSPWSRYLTGTQGVDPKYDPLQFFIDESQKRSLETHLWVNPFRILNGEGWDTLCPKHIARKHTNWVIEYNGRYYFDPGNPDAQKHIIKEILEIVKNYDLDVLHMDDYFYPYKAYSNGKLIHFDDDATWKKYGKNFKTREDWRRNNVNTFVEKLNKEIKKEKHYVKLGISPFGIWRNKSVDPKGSNTSGQTNYDDLFADVLEWIDKKWVDYILPQIYWHFDTKAAPYDVLVKWWNENTKNNIDLYVGLGVYKLGEANWAISHIKEQVDFARKHNNVNGFAHYSAKWIVNDTKGIKEYIKKEIHPEYALVPRNTNIDDSKPFQPEAFKLSNNKLTWKNGDEKHTHYFVLYRFEKDKKPNVDLAENIIGIVSAKNTLEFELKNHSDKYTYGITAVSRLHQESTPLTLEDMEIMEAINGLLADDITRKD